MTGLSGPSAKPHGAPDQQRDRDCPDEGAAGGDAGSSSGTSTDDATPTPDV